MTDHGCTIGGEPAMPILISEHAQLIARLAEAEAERDTARATLTRIAALADEYPAGIDTALIHEALAEPETP